LDNLVPMQTPAHDPSKMRLILAAVDFSDESFRALGFALPLAKRFGAPVQLLYVYEGKPSFTSGPDKPELFLDPAIELFSEHEISGRLEDEVQRRFFVDLNRKDCHFRIGRASPEICATAHKLKADLVILAAHRHMGLKHLTLGGTAEKVVRHADCPVLVVREDGHRPVRVGPEGIILRKILVPTDFSQCAREGVNYAAAFAARLGAKLLLMHVVQPPDYSGAEAFSDTAKSSPLLSSAKAEADEKLREFAKSISETGVSVETEIEIGLPSEKISEASKRSDVDMLITSTHGYSGLRHALIGSTAEQVVRLAHCPVLTVSNHIREAGESMM
jgi:nucleotide-binding universal stress UspA family protein